MTIITYQPQKKIRQEGRFLFSNIYLRNTHALKFQSLKHSMY